MLIGRVRIGLSIASMCVAKQVNTWKKNKKKINHLDRLSILTVYSCFGTNCHSLIYLPFGLYAHHNNYDLCWFVYIHTRTHWTLYSVYSTFFAPINFVLVVSQPSIHGNKNEIMCAVAFTENEWAKAKVLL